MNIRLLLLSLTLTFATTSCSLDPTSTPDPQGSVLAANCEYIDEADKRFIACKGAFKAGGAQALCSKDYSIQVPDMPQGLAAKCQAFHGGADFFAANVEAWNDPLAPFNTMSCQQNTTWLRGLMGCGGIPNATASPMCMGWPVEVICQKTTEWSCQGGLLGAANTNPKHGVICFNPNP